MNAAALDADGVFVLLSRFHPQDSPQALEFLHHLLESDSATRAACGPLLEAYRSLPDPTVPDLYLTVSRREARAHWDAELVGLPLELLAPRIHALVGRVLWGMAEVLCQKSRAAASRDPQLAGSLADLAIAAAGRAPLVRYITTSSMREELVTAAYAFLANAHRAADRMTEARALFARVERLRPASNTLGLRSVIYSLRASLEIDERRFEAALDTIATALVTSDEDPHKGRLFLQRAIIWSYSGEPVQALEAVEQALALLKDSSGERPYICALQHQVDLLSRLGRFEEARDRLPDLRRHVAALDSEIDHLRLQWVEARTAAGLGQARESEALYREVRAGFLRHSLPYSAAVATVELARHLFRQGRFSEVASLAVESAVEFRRQGVEEEVVATLALLEEATHGHLTLAAIEQLLKRVETASIGK